MPSEDVIEVRSRARRPKIGAGRTKRPKKVSRTKLIKQADKLASLYVRQKGANDKGMVKCYTCPNINHWKKLQNGHWIVRQYKYVRWDEDNMRPQCYACNFLFNGRPHIFRENLVDEIGEVRVKSLEYRAKTLFTEKDEWIQAIINIYEQKLKNLSPSPRV